jgi:3-phosphoglycerate kinase
VNYFLKNFFISTGGGASLEFLEAFLKNKGQKALSHYLPGTKVLID